jgi:pyruvate/2-oxoglutarate dehydrogenase complex dihydrolipoamide acyltransferase (E2) component
MVRMKYTGASIGKQTIAGPSYTRYKYGRTARYLHICVKPEDVNFLLETGQFVEDPLPVEPEAERGEPEPEDVVDPEPLRERSEPDTDETLDLEIDLTSAAQALTEKHDVSLIDLMEVLGGEGSGVDGRVLKSDVEAYLDYREDHGY